MDSVPFPRQPALEATGWLIVVLALLFVLSLVAGLALGDVFETRHYGSGL